MCGNLIKYIYILNLKELMLTLKCKKNKEINIIEKEFENKSVSNRLSDYTNGIWLRSNVVLEGGT